MLVTVGTTSFEGLVLAAGSEPFLDALRSIGCASLTLQVGRGLVLPFSVPPDHPDLSGAGVYVQVKGIASVRVVRFIPCLALHPSDFSLVVSHCGAGSLLEALRAGLRVVACVNPTLLHNHQTELARQLAGGDYCVTLYDLDELPAKTLEAWHRPFVGSEAAVGTVAAAAVAAASDARKQQLRPLVPLPLPNRRAFLQIISEEVGEFAALETDSGDGDSTE